MDRGKSSPYYFSKTTSAKLCAGIVKYALDEAVLCICRCLIARSCTESVSILLKTFLRKLIYTLWNSFPHAMCSPSLLPWTCLISLFFLQMTQRTNSLDAEMHQLLTSLRDLGHEVCQATQMNKHLYLACSSSSVMSSASMVS